MNFAGIFSLLLLFTQQFYPLRAGLVAFRSPYQKCRGIIHYRNNIVSREAVLPPTLALEMSFNQDIAGVGVEKAANPDVPAGKE